MAAGAGHSSGGEDRDGGECSNAEPAVTQSADGGLTDSIVGMFDRLREAAEAHDGEAPDGE